MNTITTENGNIILEQKAYKDIVQLTATKLDGVIPAKNENDFVNIAKKDNKIIVTVSIKLLQGIDVMKVCNRLQTRIHDNIQGMTDTEVDDIIIDVQGFIVEKK